MARPSPITLGAIALTVVVTALAISVAVRPRTRLEASPAAADGTAAAFPAPEPNEAAPGTVADGPLAFRPGATAGPSVAPPAPAVADPALTAQAGEAPPPPDASFAADPGTARKPHVLAIADRNQKIIEVGDENVFDTLRLPDTTRAAIRHLNEDAATRARAAIDRDPLHPPRTDEGAPERRAALETLLGDEAASQFANSEMAATRHLRLLARTRARGLPAASAAPSPSVLTPGAL